jgi:hypothetical protein
MSQQLDNGVTTRDALVAAAVTGACLVLLRFLRASSRTTPVRGPPRSNAAILIIRALAEPPSRASLLYGQSETLRKAFDTDGVPEIEEGWLNEYGAVYKRPTAFGSNVLMLTDPKAMAHFYGASEVWPSYYILNCDIS